jgi:hypothetical protein
MQKHPTTLVFMSLAAALFAGCGGGGNSVTSLPQKPGYSQIERLSRPAIKEVFEPFNDHKISNAAEPYNDPTIQADIIATEDYVRPPNATKGTDYGKTLAGILYPDEYTVDLSQTGVKAAYLGVETKGATGSLFGGRDLTDDVVGISLGALFGNTLSTVAPVTADDGEENNCLSTENLAQRASQTQTATFPYFSPPH